MQSPSFSKNPKRTTCLCIWKAWRRATKTTRAAMTWTAAVTMTTRAVRMAMSKALGVGAVGVGQPSLVAMEIAVDARTNASANAVRK